MRIYEFMRMLRIREFTSVKMEFLNKKILIIVLLSVVSVGIFYAKVDLASEGHGDYFSNVMEVIKAEFLAMAQEIVPDESYFFPTYPQRLMYLIAEISQSGEELTALNQGLVNETEKCDCKFALSQCLKKGLGIFTTCQPGSLKVFGDPCPNREKIEEKQSEIIEKNDQITHLRNLLKKEMETGLERELKTLRPEVAQNLKNNLEKILETSGNIISPAETNLGLLRVSQIGNCSATCELGPICGVKFCVALGIGEQKQIEFKFNIGVALDDLKLGKIGIKNIHLVLPEEIQLPKIEDGAIVIPSQEVVVAFPNKPLAELDLSSQTISLSTQISLPQPEPIKLSCPKLSFLKTPEILSFPELPEKIEIPSLKIPEIKFCPKLPALLKEIPLIPKFEEITERIEKTIEETVEKLEEKIKELEEQVKTVTDTDEKNKLDEEIKKLKEEYGKIKEAVEIETPKIEFQTPEPSKKTELKSPEIKQPNIELPRLGLSSSYQCLSASHDNKTTEIGESIETAWYFQTFSFLSEKCQTLPIMGGMFGIREKAKDCFSSEKLPSVIQKECDSLWDNYCVLKMPGFEPPEICKKIRYSCVLDSKIAAAVQCQNLFIQEKENIPSSCEFDRAGVKFSPDFNPVATLKNKCEKLKDSGRKDAPEICKLLPLFTGEIGVPYSEMYSTSKNSCPAQKIGDFPAGLGGIQLNCSFGLPTLPKIILPDIIIPDIIMPEFSIPPFFTIKLPNFILEDLILPDIDLCNLDDCQKIFPDLNFRLPFLNLPSLSPAIRIPSLEEPFEIPMPEIKLSIGLPLISFNLPRLNLGSLLAAELEIPEIPVPKPKITFGFSGIDLSAIFALIKTFLLNAMGVPDFSLCIGFQIPSVFLAIIYPDYYISWLDFPEIPEIPFCKDINQFCGKVKMALGEGGWLKKAREIEKTFNQFTQTKIQAKLDKAAQVINNELTEQINLILEEYAQIIRTAVKEKIAEVQGNMGFYIDSKDKKLKIPPIVLTLPERKIDIPLSKVNDLIGTTAIAIPWPEDLKKFKLTKDLTYDLPTIPLSKLSFEKEILLKGPGFQSRTLTVNLGNLGGSGDCLSDAPTGGNPLPVSQFQSNLGNIISIQGEIQNTSNKTIDILE